MTDAMRFPNNLGHLTVAALKRHRDKPVMVLGDTTLTGAQAAAQISQYAQAFEAAGAGTGEPSALLAANRPEVLLIIGAGQMLGSRRTALHGEGTRTCSWPRPSATTTRRWRSIRGASARS